MQADYKLGGPEEGCLSGCERRERECLTIPTTPRKRRGRGKGCGFLSEGGRGLKEGRLATFFSSPALYYFHPSTCLPGLMSERNTKKKGLL